MINRIILLFLITLIASIQLRGENEKNQTVKINYLNAKSKITYDNGLTWKDISKVKIIRPNFTKTSEDGGSTWNYSYSNNTKEQENLDLKTNYNFTNLSIYSFDFRLLYNESLNKEKIDFNKINTFLKNFGNGMYIIVLTGENSNKVIKVQF
jgi:hypothetical protein